MKKISFVLLFILILSSTISAADVVPTQMKLQLQSLDNYVVTLTMKDDSNAHIVQRFDVVNRYREPIIPGRAKMVLFNGLNPENVVVSIGGSRKAINSEDVILEDGNNVIYYEIWRPITRGEHLTVEIEFDTVVETQGILFKQLNLNFGEPELTIEKMIFNLVLPSGRKVTYANPAVTDVKDNSVVIEIPASLIEVFQNEPIDVEYSIVPLPVLPFHGYWLWLILIFMSSMIMVMKIISKNKYESFSSS